MRKILKTIFAVLVPAMFCHAQIDSVYTRLFLVGDDGTLSGGKNSVIEWLKKNVDWNDEKNVIVFLGDNIYPLGLPAEGENSYAEAKSIIDYQMALIKGKKSKAYFVMGNHDWKNGKQGGWEQAVNQINYINSQEQPNIEANPRDGCPGPIEVEINEKLVLVLMDSQWWLHLHEKPGLESNCEFKTQDEIITALREIASSHPNQLLVVAMHHPMYSYGVHGGNYLFRHHIFPFTEAIPWLYIPLPILGSVYPVVRGIFGNIQDVKHPLYRTMIREIERVLKTHPNAMQVAGHDHGMQLLMKDSIPYIVSGAGVDISRVKSGKFTLHIGRTLGFAMLEIKKSGRVEAKFYDINNTNLNDARYVKELKQIVPTATKTMMDTIKALPDSFIVTANPSLKAGGLKKLLFGKNYRNEWTEPIKVPVFDISKERKGLVPKKRGGGKQTKSLRIEDTINHKEYSLRSIEKFPEGAIPAELRETFAKDIVRDGVSASYPYAALSVEPLADAAKIPYVQRKLVYVPDDPRLLRFRTDFSGILCMLEETEPSYVKKSINTEDLALRLLKDHDDHVDQKRVLKARLLDNFVMDLDRHEDQWRWATYDTGKGKMYYPIPRDHDQVFFTNQGLIPGMAKRAWLVPQIQGFRAKAVNIKTFNFAARNFDRSFLTQLSKSDWQHTIDTFLTQMTDPVIEAALRRQPVEIQKYSAGKIVQTLKNRRKYFMGDMMKYYKFISKTVNVVGSDDRELITIAGKEDRKVLVQVNSMKKNGEVSSLIYERLFDPSETKEIRIYGMGDDDKFVFSGNHSAIKLRVVGGGGKDEFNNQGGSSGRTVIYDVKFDTTIFVGNENFHKKIKNDPTNNKYERLYYKYNILHPGVSIGYNMDDGIFLGARLRYTSQGFRKVPYSKFHDLNVIHALATKSYRLKYFGEFIKVFGNSDILIDADIKAPNNTTNFFGIGNETVLDKTKPDGIKFYRARFNISDVSALIRYRLQSWMDITYGPSFQGYSINKTNNINRVMHRPSLLGLDSAGIYQNKSYLGAQLGLTIDTRNSKILPTRGLFLQTIIRPLFGLNSNSNNITQIKYDMAIFVSLVEQTKIVFGTRMGVGHTRGNYEFFQAQYLSGLDNLRGYRKQRFAGKTMFYNNNDLRIKIADINTYLFPGALGIHLFYDIGRVWVVNDPSNKWHSGFGGGLWLSPLKRFVFTLSVAHSKEETLPLATVGFQF